VQETVVDGGRRDRKTDRTTPWRQAVNDRAQGSKYEEYEEYEEFKAISAILFCAGGGKRFAGTIVGVDIRVRRPYFGSQGSLRCLVFQNLM